MLIQENNYYALYIEIDESELKFISTKNTLKLYKLNYRLVINSQNIHSTRKPAFNYESELKINDFEKCYAKALTLKNKKDLFLLKKHIDIDSFQSLLFILTKIMLLSSIFLSNNLSIDDIYLEIAYLKIEIILRKKSMQPTEEIEKAMIDALNNQ
ncbi:13094_t:CDS:1 [Cetraspora pellucida]|uniref:13094_t:CDS:1 n=1 Tax=Cetraspora pellucida TaxID=1433469 RepID=A0A9N9DY74_9GLOM|nr:13094_t:CDS:1 [Cetraspora pellucida]